MVGFLQNAHPAHEVCGIESEMDFDVFVREANACLLLMDHEFYQTMRANELDAMKRQAGRPSKENVSQVGTQKRSDQLLAEQVGQSRNQIQRYIRLTELIPELLDMVDEKKIALNPAYELSFLKKEEQVDLLDAMDSEQATPSLSQAQRLKKYSQEGHLTLDMMRVIMGEEKKSDLDRVTFTSDT